MDSDFWVLMAGLANPLDRQGSTPEQRHEHVITSFCLLSSPMKVAMLRKMQIVASNMNEVVDLAERHVHGAPSNQTDDRQ